MVLKISPNDFLQLGLETCGCNPRRIKNTCRKTNIERFRSNFGLDPAGCCAVFRDLQTTKIPEARINRPNSVYFLVALNWLRSYGTEGENATQFDTDEKTLRGHIETYVKAIAALKNEKIVWDIDNNPETFLISVDGVHFRIYEPRKRPDARWCSYKFKSAYWLARKAEKEAEKAAKMQKKQSKKKKPPPPKPVA